MTTIQCPKCPADFPARFAAIARQHAAEHARLERRHAERVTADAAVRAAYGPVRTRNGAAQ